MSADTSIRVMNAKSEDSKGFKKELTFFDLTNIIVGSIVGADIYIASALTAGMIGPFSIIIWVVAGIFATIIALVFAYCSYYVPRVGGPFAFVSYAFDDFYGFLTGWSMWIAEILALPVFAIAFVQYLQYFYPLDFFQQIIVKGLFLFTLIFINIIGVKAAGKFGSVLI
jgi:amino acid transporter